MGQPCKERHPEVHSLFCRRERGHSGACLATLEWTRAVSPPHKPAVVGHDEITPTETPEEPSSKRWGLF